MSRFPPGEKLPASERVQILTGRIEALRRGSGDYWSHGLRQQQIYRAEKALACVLREIGHEAGSA